MSAFIFFLCIALIASILQTSTGFGFSIMATPLFLVLFHPQEAIQINIILSLVISISIIRSIMPSVDFTLLKRLIAASLAGIPFGIAIHMTINIEAFKLSVGVLLLMLTLLLILNFRINQTPARDNLTGGLSGLFTTSIGMPGPPILVYFTGTSMDKDRVRATTLAFYLFIYSVSLVTQIIFTGTSVLIWKYSLYAVPAVLSGLVIGRYIYKWINQDAFRIFTYVLLSGTGLYLLIQSMLSP
ncbi:sulfite exporter TauE/SafE family protein [Salinicoccus carnicancri]|uniref:sulfite exporter TauE/SafE family protein n=1 Tax=Salinicoccus carnicancri TaxID=558170 RepID=UPI000377A117|nr:sulfite exporter TauE/SafE family protein [Salinicoccus carnicancri]